MLTFVENCVENFKRFIQWESQKDYSRLTIVSDDILGICSNSKGGELGKHVTDYFKVNYNLQLQGPKSIGFLVSSIPLPRPVFMTEPMYLNRATASMINDNDSAYLLHANTHEDGMLEAFLAYRFNKNLLVRAIDVCEGQSLSSNTIVDIRFVGDHWSNTLSYRSRDQLVGMRGLKIFHLDSPKTSLSMGGEIYYAASERGLGMSLGMKYDVADREGKRTIFTGAFSPVMGHVTSTCTTIFPELSLGVSARYEVNVYSFDSNFVVGVDTCIDRTNKSRFRGAIDLKRGLSIAWERAYERLRLRVGILTPFVKTTLPHLGIQFDYEV